MRVLVWETARARVRSAGIVAVVAAACVLLFATPASAHSFTVRGATTCPDGEHVVTWTIRNPETEFGPLTITSASAEVGGTTFAVTGYTSPIAERSSTTATTTVPGSVNGQITITVRGRWADGVTFTATGSVDLQPPCEETTTTTASTTTSTTSPPTSVTTSPPVTGGTTPATVTTPSSGVSPTEASLPAGQVGGVQAEEAGNATLPRTGADATNWTLVGLAALGFGAALLALSSTRPLARRR